MATIPTRNVKVKIVAEGEGVIAFAFDRHVSEVRLAWQEAYELAEFIARVANEWRGEQLPLNLAEMEGQFEKFTIGVKQGCVLVRINHGSRVKMSWRAALLVSKAILMKAQDCEFRETRLATLPTWGQPQVVPIAPRPASE